MTEETIKTYVRSLPADIFGLSAYKTLRCSRLERGLHNLNFKLVISDGSKTRSAALRLSATAANRDTLIRQIWYLEKLSDHIAPRILFHADMTSLGGPVLITEFVSGQHVAFNALDDVQIALLANMLVKQVHSLRCSQYGLGDAALPEATGRYRDYARLSVSKMARQYERAKSIPHDAKTITQGLMLLKQLLASTDESWSQRMFSLCHGDISVYNVLWAKHDLRLIDWDDARFGDPADDIAYIFAINGVSEHWREAFLHSYLQESADKNIPTRIEAYLLKNYLFDVVWSLGKLLEEQRGQSLIKLGTGEYQTMYERRLVALRKHLGY